MILHFVAITASKNILSFGHKIKMMASTDDINNVVKSM